MTVYNNIFEENYSAYNGAAVFLESFRKTATLKFQLNTFINNFSGSGACIDAEFHEASNSYLELSQNYFAFTPPISTSSSTSDENTYYTRVTSIYTLLSYS